MTAHEKGQEDRLAQRLPPCGPGRLADLAAENADLRESIRLYVGNQAAALLEIVALRRDLREARAQLLELRGRPPADEPPLVHEDGIAVTASAGMSIECVLAAHALLVERRRQIQVEHFIAEHDAIHCNGELAAAAASYALSASFFLISRNLHAKTDNVPPGSWPWPVEWWKPKDARRDLVRAGALILAQLELLYREPAPAQQISPSDPSLQRR